jgi:hypothetical protein
VKREAQPFDFWFSREDKIQRRNLVIAAGHPDKPGPMVQVQLKTLPVAQFAQPAGKKDR